VTSREFRERLVRRARHANVTVEADSLDRLEAYFRLLARWNEKINLTALPLATPTNETVDRLLIEPLSAARHVNDRPTRWLDLGSGGGSPAIPLKVVRPALHLTMVESKARKAAFLREALRVLELHNAVVENTRFEALVSDTGNGARAELVTVRAVRADAALLAVAAELLCPDGRLLLFRPTARALSANGFETVETCTLTPDEPRAYLSILQRCSTWNKAVDARPV
jgi:16S rRNA (guanine527-N7)-methyltransferase